jgi:spore germination protein (amino acid permease)
MRPIVTNRQIVLILYITIITTSVINVAKMQAISSGHGAWIPLLITGVLFGIMASIIVSLNKQFEGDTLFEYSGKIAGKFVGRSAGKFVAYLLAIIYTLYFMVYSSYYCITFFQLIKANILTQSPEWALLLISMPFLGFIAYKGFTNTGRLAELVGIVYLIVSLILFVTMFVQGRINYILPLYVKSETGRYFAAIKGTMGQFVGISLLTLIPIKKSDKKIGKVAFWTMIGIAVFYIMDVYGCYAMIGLDEIKHYNYPLVDAIRLVEYKKIEFFQRVDITYQTIGFIRVFVAKGIIYMAVVEYLCKIFSKAKRLVIVIITGFLLYTTDIIALGIPDIRAKLFMIRTYYAYAVCFIIPLALLMMAKVKKNGKKNDYNLDSSS